MSASLDPVAMPDRAVAVIGAGPAGLVAARYLKRHGFDPVILEASAGLGGQWNAAWPSSGIWPGMPANTSRIMTAFSDLDHVPGTSVYPSETDIRGYLRRYADAIGLDTPMRLSTRVEAVERGPGAGWVVRSRREAVATAELYRRVVVATGRYIMPDMPEIPGLAGDGAPVALHSARYRGPEAYRGKSVLVAGCSISALEIASDLAASGAAKVSVAMRRQRYVLQKLLAGIPTDHVAFTRFATQAGKTLPPEALAAALKSLVVTTSGSPEQFGAPKPDDNVFAAGLTQSQNYLALVAEGRIRPRPWIDRVDGRMVHFADGTSEAADAIILATGFKLSLPFLGGAVAATAGLDAGHLALHDYTLHPDLDGLGFIGLYPLIGPYFPVLELQARWLVYLWAGLRPMPTAEAMREGVMAARERGDGAQDVLMHVLADLFARNAGVEPDPAAWPALERALWFGPLSPASFRLSGPDAEADAPARTADAASAFNAIVGEAITAEEAARLKAVSGARAA